MIQIYKFTIFRIIFKRIKPANNIKLPKKCYNAVSTGKCKISDLFEKLGLWVRKTEFFARSEVQFLCDVLNILVREVIEV